MLAGMAFDEQQQRWRERAEPAAREWLDLVARESARLCEFTVDFPLEARKPLTATEREVACALLATQEVLDRTAQALAERGDPGWQAVSDVALWLHNDIGRRGLPQRSRVREEIAEADPTTI
jgi:hypothetical protein